VLISHSSKFYPSSNTYYPSISLVLLAELILFYFLYSFHVLGGPKVYNITTYLDDHPGGAEVMLDLAGQNADEFFEDIGHSADARNELKKYLIGTYEMSEEELEKMRADAEKRGAAGGASPMVILLVVIIAIIYAYANDLV